MIHVFPLQHSSLSVRRSILPAAAGKSLVSSMKTRKEFLSILGLPAAAGTSYKPKMRLVFQCELVFCRCVSRQLFKRFVKRASMGKKAAQ